MAGKRTPGGSVKASVREKTATLSGDRFPIFDVKSALAGLRLRGHTKNDSERRRVIQRAAQYAPEAARAARMADKKKKKK